MSTLPLPFRLVNHNKGATINILIISISIGLIIFNVNYFRTTIVRGEQIINQPTNASQSEFSLAVLWRNGDYTGVKGVNPVAVSQETLELSIVLNGIVLASSDGASFVLINEGDEQERYSLNEALESALGTFIRKINKTNVMFETHGHCEKITLHPGLPDIIRQPGSENQNVLVDYIIATPIRDGEQMYGLRLNPRKGLNASTTSLLQPGDVALGISNLSLTRPNGVSQALGLLLTQQSAQFTARHNGVPRLINISVAELTGMNGQRNERTQ